MGVTLNKDGRPRKLVARPRDGLLRKDNLERTQDLVDEDIRFKLVSLVKVRFGIRPRKQR